MHDEFSMPNLCLLDDELDNIINLCSSHELEEYSD